MLGVLVDALVPVFLGLLLGYAAGWRKVVDNRDVKGLVGFLMSFALPCSLFVAIAPTPRALLLGQVKSALVLGIVYGLVYVGTYYALRKLEKGTAQESAILALTLGFPNVAAIGIPLLQTVYGPQASVTVAVAIAVGSITVTPAALAAMESGASGGGRHVLRSLSKALKRPVFWAPVLGVLVSAVQLRTPAYLEKSLTILGAATEGTALFVTGLIVSAQRFRWTRAVAWSVLANNLVQPVLCLGVARLLRMSTEQTRYVVLLSAIPSGFFGILFGEGFGAVPEVASSSLIATTLVGILTLAVWIVLLSRLVAL